MLYRFDEFVVNLREYVLLKDGEPVHLSPKSFEVLQILLARHGHLVSKDEILDEVWKDTAVEVGRLASCVQEIRTALGDQAKSPRWIETVHKRGYRFIGAVAEEAEAVAVTVAAEGAAADGESAPLPLAPFPAIAPLPPPPVLVEPAAAPPMATVRRNPLTWVTMAAIAVTGVLAYFLLRQGHTVPPPEILSSHQLTHTSHAKLSFAAAPGAPVAWFSEQQGHMQVWRLALEDGSAQPFFADTAGNALVRDVSADGRRLLVTRFANLSQQPSTALWAMPASGGTPHLLVPDGWSGAWSPDGKQLAYCRWGDHHVYLSDDHGSHPRVIAETAGYPWDLHWSADGRRLVFSSIPSPSLETLSPEGSIYLKDIGQGAAKLLRNRGGQPVTGANPVFETGAHAIAFTHRDGGVANVWQFQFKSRMEQAITSGPSNTRLVAIGAQPDQLITAGEIPHTRLLEISGPGTAAQPVLPGIQTRDMAFSRDGRWVAYTGLDGSLWRARADGSQPQQMLPGSWNASLPVWSPDSRDLIFCSTRDGGERKLYRLHFTGNAAQADPQAITSGPGDDADANWSGDQTHILFSRTQNGVPRLEWLDLANGQLQEVSDSAGKASPRLTANGMLSAVSANGETLYLRRTLTGPWEPILTDPSGLGYNYWSRDQRSLYVLTQTPTATWKRYDLASGEIHAVADLSTISLSTGPWYGLALTAQDHLVITESSNDSELFVLTLRQ